MLKMMEKKKIMLKVSLINEQLGLPDYKDCKLQNENWEIISDEFNKILSFFFVNDVNAEKATALQ